MSSEILESKEISPVEKRAAWEAMEFRLGAPGAVRVENVSYGKESDEHVYVVTVEDEVTIECTCPADQYQQKCKHRHAVEANNAVLLAASAGVEEMQEAHR
jgi:hypothetical protein